MITDVDSLYFDWLIQRLDVRRHQLKMLCLMLHMNDFTRDVGNDINRSMQGRRLRQLFISDFIDLDIDPRKLNQFDDQECTWFEMLFALSESLDYLYDGGVKERFLELVDNLGLSKILDSPGDDRYNEIDQDLVDSVTQRVNQNGFDFNGHGGLFPLTSTDHPDQREVEIWEQHAAYFRERLEGVMWTSIG